MYLVLGEKGYGSEAAVKYLCNGVYCSMSIRRALFPFYSTSPLSMNFEENEELLLFYSHQRYSSAHDCHDSKKQEVRNNKPRLSKLSPFVFCSCYAMFHIHYLINPKPTSHPHAFTPPRLSRKNLRLKQERQIRLLPESPSLLNYLVILEVVEKL